MSSDDDETSLTPQEITNMAEEATLTLLPEKSKSLYNKSYANFMQWRTEKHINSFSENVLLAYFQEVCAKFAPSTLWSQYSMLKSTLNIYEKQDLSKYSKLHAFLKRKSEGYKTKKSKTFSPSEINKFINEAPDVLYLMTKTTVIFGVMGACRRQELHSLLFENVKDLNGAVLVNLVNTKNKVDRTFTITGKYYNLIKKYIDLRPAGCTNEHFFIKYFSGKCTNQNIGINTFGNLGKTVASYLELPNPELYTGHCFRRTSATLLIDAGGDITTLKRHGGWRSTVVAEGYIDNSIENKMKVSKTILNSIEEPQAQPVQPPPSPTFTPVLNNENINVLSQVTRASTSSGTSASEINLSQILKKNTPLIITKSKDNNVIELISCKGTIPTEMGCRLQPQATLRLESISVGMVT